MLILLDELITPFFPSWVEFHRCAVDRLAKEDLDCTAKNPLTAIDLEADLGEAIGTHGDEGPGMLRVFRLPATRLLHEATTTMLGAPTGPGKSWSR